MQQKTSESNWIFAWWWYKPTGVTAKSFRSSWIVPQEPETKASQLIYLFNGMQPCDSATILQPVLQWGGRDADEDGIHRTGQFWTVASYLNPDLCGNMRHTRHIPVKPGETLTGIITLLDQSERGFRYCCEFEGIPATRMEVIEMPELTSCIHVCEAYELDNPPPVPYELKSAREYPKSDRIAFRGIRAEAAPSLSSLNWIPQACLEGIPNFGEYGQIVSDAAVDGEVQIFYRRNR